MVNDHVSLLQLRHAGIQYCCRVMLLLLLLLLLRVPEALIGSIAPRGFQVVVEVPQKGSRGFHMIPMALEISA